MTRKGQHMFANDSFHIAVLPGDGIGPEVTAPALEVLHRIEATTPGLRFRFTEAPAGAGYYRETGRSMPESTVKLCREADGQRCAVPTAPKSCRRSNCASSSTFMPGSVRRDWCRACRVRSSAAANAASILC